jgi:poly(A) polymerase
LTELEATLGLPAEGLRRLAALTPWTDDIARDLKLSRQEQAHLELISLQSARPFALDPSDRAVRRSVFEAGKSAIDAALLAAAEADTDAATIAAHVASLKAALGSVPRNPFTSAMVAALGFPPGPAMGEVLRNATTRWLDAGLPSARKDHAALLAQAAAQVRSGGHD